MLNSFANHNPEWTTLIGKLHLHFSIPAAIHDLLHKKFLRRAETSGAVVKFARCQQDK